MASPISRAVSDLFYDSRLKVAEPLSSDGAWLRARQPSPTRLLNNDNVVLVDALAAAKAANRFRGYECEESAKLIAGLVIDHVLSWGISNVRQELIVLTPYRAQRRRIEAELTSLNLPAAAVSTVHRAQGSERRLVIFDPVCPTAEFVAGEAGMRLVNVAFSRAQCRLIVMLQRGWEQHPALRFLATQHRPVILDPDEVDRLLLKKLPPPSPAKPAATPSVGKRSSNDKRDETIFDEFVAELRIKVQGPASKPALQRAAQQLRDRAKFRKLTFIEIDAAIELVHRR